MDPKKLEELELACIQFYRSDGRTSQVWNLRNLAQLKMN